MRARLASRRCVVECALTPEEGQAFFEVTKDAHRPFVVETRRGTNRRGRYRLLRRCHARSLERHRGRGRDTDRERRSHARIRERRGRAAHLGKRGQALYSRDERGASVTALPSARPDVSWRDGQLAFYGDTLSAVVVDLNRYAPEHIQLADTHVGDLQYTGTVFPERVNDWLASLPQIFAVHVERREHGRLIVPRNVDPTAAASSAR